MNKEKPFLCKIIFDLKHLFLMPFSSKIKSNYKPKRLAVKLNSKGEQVVIQGHPWVFSNNITKINDDAKSGDLAIIFGIKTVLLVWDFMMQIHLFELKCFIVVQKKQK